VTTLQRTAVHEAAHAIVARRLGLTVQRVNIRPTSGFRGSCRVSRPADAALAVAFYSAGEFGVDLAEDGIIATPIGPIGNWFIEAGEDIPQGIERDREQVRAAHPTTAQLRAGYSFACRVLTERRDVVTRLADQLLEQGELDERELERFFERHNIERGEGAPRGAKPANASQQPNTSPRSHSPRSEEAVRRLEICAATETGDRRRPPSRPLSRRELARELRVGTAVIHNLRRILPRDASGRFLPLAIDVGRAYLSGSRGRGLR
jgi:hypothetical protein